MSDWRAEGLAVLIGSGKSNPPASASTAKMIASGNAAIKKGQHHVKNGHKLLVLAQKIKNPTARASAVAAANKAIAAAQKAQTSGQKALKSGQAPGKSTGKSRVHGTVSVEGDPGTDADTATQTADVAQINAIISQIKGLWTPADSTVHPDHPTLVIDLSGGTAMLKSMSSPGSNTFSSWSTRATNFITKATADIQAVSSSTSTNTSAQQVQSLVSQLNTAVSTAQSLGDPTLQSAISAAQADVSRAPAASTLPTASGATTTPATAGWITQATNDLAMLNSAISNSQNAAMQQQQQYQQPQQQQYQPQSQQQQQGGGGYGGDAPQASASDGGGGSVDSGGGGGSPFDSSSSNDSGSPFDAGADDTVFGALGFSEIELDALVGKAGGSSRPQGSMQTSRQQMASTLPGGGSGSKPSSPPSSSSSGSPAAAKAAGQKAITSGNKAIKAGNAAIKAGNTTAGQKAVAAGKKAVASGQAAVKAAGSASSTKTHGLYGDFDFGAHVLGFSRGGVLLQQGTTANNAFTAAINNPGNFIQVTQTATTDGSAADQAAQDAGSSGGDSGQQSDPGSGAGDSGSGGGDSGSGGGSSGGSAGDAPAVDATSDDQSDDQTVFGADGSLQRKGAMRDWRQEGLQAIIGAGVPSLFVYHTGADIRSDMDSVKSVASQLNADVAASTAPATFKAGWANFFAELTKWYSDNYSNFFSGNALYEKALEYRQRVVDWRNLFESTGGVATGPAPNPAPGNPDPNTNRLLPNELPWWVWVAGVGAATVLLAPTVAPLVVVALAKRKK